MDAEPHANTQPLLPNGDGDAQFRVPEDKWSKLHATRELRVGNMGANSPNGGAQKSTFMPPAMSLPGFTTTSPSFFRNPYVTDSLAYPMDRLNIQGLSTPPIVSKGKRGARPRILYDQHRCRLCIPPLSILTIAAGMIITGSLLLIPPLRLREFFKLDTIRAVDGVAIISYSLIALGICFPIICLAICVRKATPSKAQRQTASAKADALLETLLAHASLDDHYDAAGQENANNGTVLLLAGPSCPRITMQGFADALSVHFKTISVDMPGHGSLVNVQFSLARCERVFAKVLEREFKLMPGQLSVAADILDNESSTVAAVSRSIPISASSLDHSAFRNSQVYPSASYGASDGMGSGNAMSNSVPHDLFRILESGAGGTTETPSSVNNSSRSLVIISYGASAYVAAYFAQRYPDIVAGIALLGPVPDYNVPGCCTGAWESMYRLRWAASLVNLGVKGRIRAHPKVLEAQRKELLSYDWHVSALPDFIAEVAGRELITNLKNLPRNILVLAPIRWGAKARRIFLTSQAAASITVNVGRGLSDDKLPTLNPAKLSVLTSQLLSFCRDAFQTHEQRLYLAYINALNAAQEAQARANRSSGQSRFGSTSTDLFAPSSPGLTVPMSQHTHGSIPANDQHRRSTFSSGRGSFVAGTRTSQGPASLASNTMAPR